VTIKWGDDIPERLSANLHDRYRDRATQSIKRSQFKKADIEQGRFSNQSIMPIGLLGKMIETELIDLLKFVKKSG
jgi:hypothetical protein